MRNQHKQIASAVISLLLISSVAYADTVTLTPTASGYAVDGGQTGNWVLDGIFDELGTASDAYIRKYRSLDFTKYVEFRGALEYTLPSVLTAPGVNINAAMLVLNTSYTYSTIGDYIYAYGYAADGAIDLGDFDNIDDFAGSVEITGGSGYFNRTYVIDVTNTVASAAGAPANIGFVTAVSWWDVYVTYGLTAELQIEYDVVSADGDLNQDGVVDVVDVLLAQRIVVGQVVPDAIQLLHGDVAPQGAVDGRIDIADVLLISRKAAGQDTGF